MSNALITALRQLVYDMPDEWVSVLAHALERAQGRPWAQVRARAEKAISQPSIAYRVAKFLNVWEQVAPEVTPNTVALALLAAADMETYCREQQHVELVWTGPDSKVVPLRRTDQALLQLIDTAVERLHIVSFAVYNVGKIAAALVAAAERGVAISLYLEMPEASEGKIAYNTLHALGKVVAEQASVYIWPLEQRNLNEQGKHGSLHAKFAVADGRLLFISSANLTQYAMTLNMELGLLIRDGQLPVNMEQHLDQLVERRVFQRLHG